MSIRIQQIKLSTPFEGQKPGTSGLRKRVKEFQKPGYTESFVQSILTAIPEGAKHATLVLGGDGRYYSTPVISTILRMAAANGVARVIVAQQGILSTPAASNIIRRMKATGGIILTASHNPGGPDHDFGIKYNMSNGGPAPESITNAIWNVSKTLTSYWIAEEKVLQHVDLTTLGRTTCQIQAEDGTSTPFIVDVIDSVDDYVDLMKSIFDFPQIRSFLQARQFKVLFDSMHGVTGPYARRLLINELELPETSVMNAIPLPDFGHGHPDPNLTYAKELVDRVAAEGIELGAASDGDGDRNMILGRDCFVNPSDSVAVIAANYQCIPYFAASGLKGLARSMPTSAAIDLVAKQLGVPVYEVPTGWKFFGNLMDAGKLSICGEESFGTGSDHIREKDGCWAVLAWLQILAHGYKENPAIQVKDILDAHYAIYGRNYFSRYDYEDVESEGAQAMMNHLQSLITTPSTIGSVLAPGFTVAHCDDFSYTDPIDGSVSKGQGIRFLFTDGSRFVIRLSGTGSAGATIRLYVERYSREETSLETRVALRDLIEVALKTSGLRERTGRSEPTVIT